MARSHEPKAEAPEAHQAATGVSLAEVARQVAELLRQAEDAATTLRAAATVDAEAIRAAARREADVQHADADAHLASARLASDEMVAQAEAARDQAKRLLIRARNRADHLLADAETQGAGMIAEAEEQARAHADAIVAAGRRRLQQVQAEEARARRRLVEAQEAVHAIAQRLAAAGPVIDLTGDEPVVLVPTTADDRTPVTAATRTDRREPTLTPSVVAHHAGEIGDARGDLRADSIGLGWSRSAGPPRRRRTDRVDRASGEGATPRSTRDDGAPPTSQPDPLSFMIRRAVDRAVATSSAGARARPGRRLDGRRR